MVKAGARPGGAVAGDKAPSANAAGDSPAVILVVAGSAGTSSRSPLPPGRYTIGREDCDVVIADGTVSGKHAEIEIDSRGWRIHDLGSRNGTFAGGQRIEDTPWSKTAGAVRLGSVAVAIEIPGAAAAARPARKQGPISGMSWGMRPLVLTLASLGCFAFVVILILNSFAASAAEQRRNYIVQMVVAQYQEGLDQGRIVPAGALPGSVARVAEPIVLTDYAAQVADVIVLDANGNYVFPNYLAGQPVEFAADLAEKVRRRPFEKEMHERVYAMQPVLVRGVGKGYAGVAFKPAGAAEKRRWVGMVLVAMLIASPLAFLGWRRSTAELAAYAKSLRGKLLPFQRGYETALPRLAGHAEMGALAAELEKVLSASSAGEPGSESHSRAGDAGLTPAAAALAELLRGSGIAYCVLDREYKVLAYNQDWTDYEELSQLRVGESLFNEKLTNFQSKELVRVLQAAMRDGSADAAMSLTRARGGAAAEVSVRGRLLGDPAAGKPCLGLICQALGRKG